ncbi:DUF2007 domain-containing protein [Vibrio mimicus]|nr:DUF2007 domain-containing protein [Vibrio mimicus]QXC58738.1 DUF2007 domain-containing protein [Vibrio mimicus]
MKIYTASNPLEAHMLMQLLRQQGIRCEMRGEMLFALRGEIPIDQNSAPSLWLVNPSQQKAAEQVIADFFNPPATTRWQCPECGESHEGQFAVCWQCGYTQLDD